MIKKLSLRIKVTLISTVIMIFISVILTITSVYNANYGFSSMLTAMNAARMDGNEASKIPSIDGVQSSVLSETTKYNGGNWSGNFIEPFSYNSLESAQTALLAADTTSSVASIFKYNAIVYMLILIGVGSVFIYFILGRVFKPVKKLSDEIEIINVNKLSQRVTEYDNKDEINELAKAFNSMLDRLDKSFESQKRFSSDAAHELKTPLTALKTNLDILSIDENPSEEDYKRIVSIFNKQTNRMIDLVNNLFVLSAQKEYEFNDLVAFDAIVKDILLDLDSEIKKKNLNISFKESKINIKGNKIMLTHAISNLVENAVKYNNNNGSINVEVLEENKKCIITVKDTGIGIDASKASYIFDAFYRVDTSRSRKVGGAGLGLAITKDIINKHGGKIEYFPNDEGGCIFKITLQIIN